MRRWTMKELGEVDDITFAMCVLAERGENLNRYTPLTQKIRSAYRTLEQLRDGR